VAVGSTFSLACRIKKMMSLIGNQPIMWVNVKSLLDYGPYAESNMLLRDRALVQACASYPNMRVYDWPRRSMTAGSSPTAFTTPQRAPPAN